MGPALQPCSMHAWAGLSMCCASGPTSLHLFPVGIQKPGSPDEEMGSPGVTQSFADAKPMGTYDSYLSSNLGQGPKN